MRNDPVAVWKKDENKGKEKDRDSTSNLANKTYFGGLSSVIGTTFGLLKKG